MRSFGSYVVSEKAQERVLRSMAWVRKGTGDFDSSLLPLQLCSCEHLHSLFCIYMYIF